TFATRDFAGFMREFKRVEGTKEYDMAAIQPSISTGGTVVGPRNAQEAVASANEAANACKITYKTALGMNVCKYGRVEYLPVDPNQRPPRNLEAVPDPVIH